MFYVKIWGSVHLLDIISAVSPALHPPIELLLVNIYKKVSRLIVWMKTGWALTCDESNPD